MNVVLVPCRTVRRSIVFDHVYYGPLFVANMLDVDNAETDDIELVCRLVCPMPDGQWLATCACPNCGRLREVKSGVH